MGLKEYRHKRDFSRTSEPGGRRVKRTPGKQLSFVVHKHAARRLHYDLRLELDGVLKSWAVPKGPSLDPQSKRLAVRVEDHPLDYKNFEGVIPQGEYGAGPVIVWDRGTWTPLGDAREAIEDGPLHFTLKGSKLKGGWVLVKIGAHTPGNGKHNWLLIKENDSYAESGPLTEIVDREPKSVKSKKKIEAIARGSQEHSR